MDLFTHLHPTEKPIMLDGAVIPVGYVVQTKDFEFTAVYDTDGSINVYVEWGDDQGGDMASHPSMSEAKRYLETLLKATEPEKLAEPPAVKPDMAKIISESVVQGLDKAGLPDTPKNRLEVLNDMHKKLVDQEPSAHAIRHILVAIEDQVIELQDQL
jgi:hypothetical protein